MEGERERERDGERERGRERDGGRESDHLRGAGQRPSISLNSDQVN